jgi:hypothetical protein
MNFGRWMFGLLILAAVDAEALTVSGTVTDVAGTPLPGIRVEVYDEDAALDDLLEVVYTDALGMYSSSQVTNGDDVYVVVKWEWEMTPAAAFQGHVVRLVDLGSGNPFVVATTFTPVTVGVLTDVTTNVTLNVTLGQQAPAQIQNLATQVMKVLTYVQGAKGNAPWTVFYDIPVHLQTDLVTRYYDAEMWIAQATFNGTGTTKQIVDLFHEVGHLVHRHHNGGQLPPGGANCGSHSINTEEDPECAVKEGYASYLAHLTAVFFGQISPFYQAYQDDGSTGAFPAFTLWRGDETPPTGQQLAIWESGEVVEGAVAGFLFSVKGAFSFERLLTSMNQHHPYTVRAIAEGLAQDSGPGPDTDAYFAALQKHGVTLTRSRFTANPFAVGPPPNSAPGDAGNRKIVAGLTLLRGTVQLNVEPVTAVQLGVAATIPVAAVAVGAKSASPGLADLPTGAGWTFGPPDPAPSGVVSVDTRTFGAGASDGNWDLLLQAVNSHEAEDTFLPAWAGDPTVAVNAEEKVLKLLGTWYDADRNPVTNTDPEGMVVVDNTAPTVSNFKP